MNKKAIGLFFLVFLNLLTFSCAGIIKDRIKNKLAKEEPPVVTLQVDQKIDQAGEFVGRINVDNRLRYYKIYIPQNYLKNEKSKKEWPVIFALHGGGGDMSIMSKNEYYRLQSAADNYNFVIVFLNGFSVFDSQKLATWNAGACCAQARDNKVDDVKFVKSVVSILNVHLGYSPKKLFALGMSNGGMMSYKLACEMSDTFSAIASVAGTDNTIECQPKNKVSIFHIHAIDDDHVLYNGGLGPKAISKSAETEFKSVQSTLQKWINLNQLKPISKSSNYNSEVQCEIYDQSIQKTSSKVIVKHCKIPSGGHSWPGGSKPKTFLNSSQNYNKFPASDEILKFFSNL